MKFGEWLSTLRLRLRALLHRRQLERDLEDEIRFHKEMGGERFGNTTYWKETCRDMWTFYWLETLRQDLRYAGRVLFKSPAFALVAVLTLALGIGANTAIFSVVNAAILRPLPYRDADRLMELWGNVKRTRVERRGTSLPDYADWRDQNRSFESMALFDGATLTVTGLGEPERLDGEYVAHSYFSMLGVEPALGRVFRADEDEVPQRDRVALLSDSLWKRRFGGDAGIAGKQIQLDGQQFTIVGVMPPWFRGLTDTADIWLPLHMTGSAADFANRGSRGPAIVARLRAGVSMAAAQGEMDLISRRLEKAYPRTNEGRGVEVSPLARELLGDFRKPLLVLWTAVGFVLLIACMNVANLLLARSETRSREMALRVALGAGRARVLHQLLAEGLLLAGIGAAAGIALAFWGVRLLMAASPVNFPSFVHPSPDATVMVFTVLVTVAVGLAMGFLPAMQLRSGNLAGTFQQATGRATSSRGGNRFRGMLVVAEVAFATLLLVAAILLMRSVQQLARIHPGYDPDGVLALRVGFQRPGDAALRDEVVSRVSHIPMVESAALGSDVPLAGGGAIFYTAEGQPPVTAQNRPRAYVHQVSPGFFHALRIPFRAGRSFLETERFDNNVAVVSEALARRFWPGQDPTGKRLKLDRPDSAAPWINIVGVVNDMKYRGLPENPTADPDIFMPYGDRSQGLGLIVRGLGDGSAAAQAVRKVIRDLDPSAVIFKVSTLQEFIGRETANSRFTGWLMVIFAGAALLLAMIGIYGLMAYSVVQRTQEIGVRVALGAGRLDVLRLMVGRGMVLIAAGLGIGIGGALAATRLMGSLLFGVGATDLATFAGAGLLLATVALAACVIPAARASRIAPATALRNE